MIVALPAAANPQIAMYLDGLLELRTIDGSIAGSSEGDPKPNLPAQVGDGMSAVRDAIPT